MSCSPSCGRDCFTVLGCAPTDCEPLREQSTTTTFTDWLLAFGKYDQYNRASQYHPTWTQQQLRDHAEATLREYHDWKYGGVQEPAPVSKVEQADPVNAPAHYTSHPSGVECRTIARHMSYNLGSAFKYIWRAGLKGDAVEDLRKAVNALEDEIARLEAQR